MPDGRHSTIGKGTVDVEGYMADEHLYVTSCLTSGRCQMFISGSKADQTWLDALKISANVHKVMFMDEVFCSSGRSAFGRLLSG